jgi:hypothetical protein
MRESASTVNASLINASARRRVGWYVALAGLSVFAAALVAEHAMTPHLDPARHQISEYANARAGVVMVAGFAAWGISLAATAVVVWGPRERRVVALLLIAAALGIAVVASFRTQTSAGLLPPGTVRTTEGRLHDLGSGLATLALLGAAIASMAGSPRVFRRQTAAIVVAAIVTNGVLLVVGRDVGGLRQRLLILCACIWQILLLRLVRARRL